MKRIKKLIEIYCSGIWLMLWYLIPLYLFVMGTMLLIDIARVIILFLKRMG